jgi:hypothetical protein
MAEVPEDEPKGGGERLASGSLRIDLPHREGTRVQVSTPVRVGGARPWMCAVKLMGHRPGQDPEDEPTQTLLLRTGRGVSPEEAQRDALAQITHFYGRPTEPVPQPIIQHKLSTPPPPPIPRPRRGWLARVASLFGF